MFLGVSRKNEKTWNFLDFSRVLRTLLRLVTWPKDHVAFSMGVSHGKSASCLVQCPRVYCKWGYNVFILSCGRTRPLLEETCEFMGESSSQSVIILITFCDHSHCEVTTLTYLVAIGLVQVDIKYLICHVTSQNYVIEGLCNFMGRYFSFVTIFPSLVTIGIKVVHIFFQFVT